MTDMQITIIVAVLVFVLGAGPLAMPWLAFNRDPLPNRVAHHALPLRREATWWLVLRAAALLDLITLPGREHTS